LDRVLVFLGEVKLTLLIEACLGISLIQVLPGSPVLGELLRETALRGYGREGWLICWS
jgi:hypothetical protein